MSKKNQAERPQFHWESGPGDASTIVIANGKEGRLVERLDFHTVLATLVDALIADGRQPLLKRFVFSQQVWHATVPFAARLIRLVTDKDETPTGDYDITLNVTSTESLEGQLNSIVGSPLLANPTKMKLARYTGSAYVWTESIDLTSMANKWIKAYTDGQITGREVYGAFVALQISCSCSAARTFNEVSLIGCSWEQNAAKTLPLP